MSAFALGEILDVPVSVESSHFGLNTDFYNIYSSLDYGTADINLSELTTASQVGDCRKVVESSNNESYRPCAHVVTENWQSGLEKFSMPGIEPPMDLGALGEQFWFVPRFTAERDPTLVSYIGLAGDGNRLKLAERFKRPTTWKQYCEEVSTNYCTTNDGVAARAPVDEVEGESMFVNGLYAGHFRATAQNNCTLYPLNCTGHIADYPCSWGSLIPQQTSGLNIALESSGADINGGYSSSQLKQIWEAANATKSDVVMMWWSPEALYQTYREYAVLVTKQFFAITHLSPLCACIYIVGTDAEFTRVVLPPPSQECQDARINLSVLCEGNKKAMQGNPKGACDYDAEFLKKLIAKGFQELTSGPNIPEALWSPAYDVVANFQMTSLELGKILMYWLQRGTDKYNFDPRDATCRWVVENLELVESFIPQSYPRVQAEDVSGRNLLTAAIAVAGFAILMVISSMFLTFLRRHTKVMYYTQVEFLFIFQSGILLVALGGVMKAVPPTDATCVSVVWLTNIGYALQLVPLIVRIDAISKLASKGKQMQRVRLRPKKLVYSVAILVCLVGAFLLAWTFVDPPEKGIQYRLTGQMTAQNETVVTTTESCSYGSNLWFIVSLCWQALLLFPAAVVAFVASRVVEDMNDTKSMAFVIYADAAFLILRAAVFATVNSSYLRGYDSIIVSMDAISSILIYMVPKFLKSGEEMAGEVLPDLFLNTTIIFAQIEGFSAWSSVREPVQVFKFLESLFENFDVIAERHKVYKVETSGERYGKSIHGGSALHVNIFSDFRSDCQQWRLPVYQSLARTTPLQWQDLQQIV